MIAVADPSAVVELDLRGTPCPLNFIRTKLALERLAEGQILQVLLDRGEPEQMVSEGIAAAGHGVSLVPRDGDSADVMLKITPHG